MIGIGIGGTLVQELQLNYRSLALAIAALSLLQIAPAAAQAVYVAPGGVYVGGGPVYVIPAPPNGAPPFGPALGAAVVTGYGGNTRHTGHTEHTERFGPCCAPGRNRARSRKCPGLSNRTTWAALTQVAKGRRAVLRGSAAGAEPTRGSPTANEAAIESNPNTSCCIAR